MVVYGFSIALTNRAAAWLEAAGVKVPRKPDGMPDCTLEIAPSFALTPEDVKAKRDQIPEIKPGTYSSGSDRLLPIHGSATTQLARALRWSSR